jgi:hypothetical protein
MIKNVDKKNQKEEQKNSPYSRLINIFKEIEENHKEDNEKYSSITNRSSLL